MKTFYIVEVKNKFDPDKVCWEAYRSTFLTRVLGIFDVIDYVPNTLTFESPVECEYLLRLKLGGESYRIVEEVQI